MTEYKQFDMKVWTTFGKDILSDQGSEKQTEFLRVCKSGKEEFLDYMKENLCSVEGSILPGIVVDFKHRFTEEEFYQLPPDTQKIIWGTFKEVEIEVKFSCGFWGYVIYKMVADDCIKPSYLATDPNNTTKTGDYEIDWARSLEPKVGENRKKIDIVVRRILRSMCNPAPRGKRIVFNDFYLGKSYWRWYWADTMSKHIKLKVDDILEVYNETSYGDIAAKMHSSKGQSYIGEKNILGGLLLFLRQETLKGKKLGKVIDRLSYLSAWKAIELQEPQINQQEIQQIAKSL